jgi:hypothetical protein
MFSDHGIINIINFKGQLKLALDQVVTINNIVIHHIHLIYCMDFQTISRLYLWFSMILIFIADHNIRTFHLLLQTVHWLSSTKQEKHLGWPQESMILLFFLSLYFPSHSGHFTNLGTSIPIIGHCRYIVQLPIRAIEYVGYKSERDVVLWPIKLWSRDMHCHCPLAICTINHYDLTQKSRELQVSS